MAMSGGADSNAAALLEKDKGHIMEVKWIFEEGGL